MNESEREQIRRFLRQKTIYCQKFKAQMSHKQCQWTQTRLKAQRVMESRGGESKRVSNYDPCLGCEYDTREGGHSDRSRRVGRWGKILREVANEHE